MIVFFAICGGAIGGFLLMFGLLFAAMAQGDPMPQNSEEFGQFLLIFPVAMFFGALVGFVPALVGGAIYAFLPPSLQRIVIAPFIGGIISACWAGIVNAGSMLVAMAIAGAGSALVCALVARKCGIDFYANEAGASQALRTD